ncbi:hypothetical protein SKB0087_11570 [Anaerococcus nagyae]
MKPFEKKKQQEQVIKSLTISRYTFLRYFTTIVFFLSLYWFISSFLANRDLDLLIPIIVGISQILVNSEMYNAIQFRNDGRLIKSYYILLLDIILLVITLIIAGNNYKKIFPYLTSKNFALIFLSLLIVLVVLCFYRVYRIKNMTDKTYKKIEEYKNK